MNEIDYRSWGETRNCKGCRFWSEMLAESRGNGLQAMCIAGPDAPLHTKYTSGHQSCDSWMEGSQGAVDSPGGDPYAETYLEEPQW